MPIGNNVNLRDRLIKKTTGKTNITSKITKVSIEKPARYSTRHIATGNTKKMTFYVKQDLLKKLYNFAYWDRHNITEAFNMVLSDGLKDKNTKLKE
jgi:hypothetical protein